jgi:heme-degrading monooxygenase HmoA
MIRATLTMKVKAGHERNFEHAWLKVAAHTLLMPGNIRQTLLHDPVDPTLFVIDSDWESREAFGRYERSEEQEILTAPLREMRESVKMNVYDLITHFEKEKPL